MVAQDGLPEAGDPRAEMFARQTGKCETSFPDRTAQTGGVVVRSGRKTK